MGNEEVWGDQGENPSTNPWSMASLEKVSKTFDFRSRLDCFPFGIFWPEMPFRLLFMVWCGSLF